MSPIYRYVHVYENRRLAFAWQLNPGSRWPYCNTPSMYCNTTSRSPLAAPHNFQHNIFVIAPWAFEAMMSPLPSSPIKATAGVGGRSPMGSLQKTPSKKERRASALTQEQSQPLPKDEEQVPRALKFEEKNRGPKPPRAANDATAIAAVSGTAPARASNAVGKPPRATRNEPAHLPLRRMLIRASGKKCWEAMSPMAGYQQWRKMQYSMNWRMLLLLRGVANMSLLRLTDADVQLAGKDVVEIADGDPNPDADVKFMANGAHRVAPDSILRFYGPGEGGGDGDGKQSTATSSSATAMSGSSATTVDPTLPWCLLIGCPGHISIGILWPERGKRAAFVEHFDSRGINESIKAGGGSYSSLPHIREYFQAKHGVTKLKSVNAVDFQEKELDVYCQTWIFYFV
jgi:hypothetical protein